MPSIRRRPLPPDALLARYADGGIYTDCFSVRLDAQVGFATYVEAFYTTWLFRLERVILARLFDPASTDAEATALASGSRDRFAAWFVEDRGDAQLLLCAVNHRTRSWLMVAPAGPAATELLFGSAVLPAPGSGTARPSLGPGYTSLLGLHRLYSRALLAAARRRVAAISC